MIAANELSVSAKAFYEDAATVMTYLAGRWADEKQHESIEDYAEPLRPIASRHGVAISRMLRRPFGCEFRVDGRTYKATVSGRTYKYTRIA
jgi:hypothetical protein